MQMRVRVLRRRRSPISDTTIPRPETKRDAKQCHGPGDTTDILGSASKFLFFPCPMLGAEREMIVTNPSRDYTPLVAPYPFPVPRPEPTPPALIGATKGPPFPNRGISFKRKPPRPLQSSSVFHTVRPAPAGRVRCGEELSSLAKAEECLPDSDWQSGCSFSVE